MESKINFNLNPYYDDFDQTKGFHRILFNPGKAVQARELTQLQSQLQNQITKFGDHIFKDGSLVLGGETYTNDVSYILTSNTNDIENFTDQIFTGQTSGAKGKIVKISEYATGIYKIYFSYLNGYVFSQGESVICDNTTTETVENITAFFGTATAFSIADSVFYAYGCFVYCASQTIIIAEDAEPTCRIGLLATEAIIDSSSDTSLLDPALGAYNYSAPGADRYYIDLELYSYEYTPGTDTVENNASDNFIELSRFEDGVQVSVVKYPLYSELENTLARRTYDESGDYTVKAFGLKVIDHKYANSEFLSLQIEPGKAYVRGYEFETIAPTYIDLPKARTYDTQDGSPAFVNYGKYLLIEDINGDIDYTGNKNIGFYDITDTIIGNGRAKHIEFDAVVANKNVYKLYIDNVSFNSANSTTDVIKVANTSLAYNASISTNSYTANVSISGNDNSSYILKLPKEYVKTLLVGGTGDTIHETIKRFTSVAFTSNGTSTIATINNPITNQSFLGSGTLGQTSTNEQFYVSVITSSNEGLVPANHLLTYADGLRVIFTDPNNLTLTFPQNVNLTATVIAQISISDAQHKVKTLTNGLITISGASLTSANLSGTVSLEKSDCYKLYSILATDNNSVQYDYTNHYDFSTGQTDVLYDHGFISLKPGSIDPVRDNIANIQSVSITFDYFTHSGDSGFCSVDSYVHGSGVAYEDVPYYTSSTGEIFDLKNCVDFRPRRNDGSTAITGQLFATPSSIFYSDFDHYLGRIDKLILTKERKFSLIKGIASENPLIPSDIPDSMKLYIINVPPYTLNPSEVTYSFIENKRYTMRDIGKIEKRVEKLEYYTSLSLLEKQAKDESIPSDVPTIDRFKNGILVDSFAGHSVGDVSNIDYKCSIDYNKRILRPPFSSTSFTFLYNSGTNSLKNGELVTLNYTTETFLNQPLVSTYVNLNPYNVFSWDGIVELIPSSDNWVDTYSKPDVLINLNGENDVYTVLANNITNPASIGVRWSDWQTLINGTEQTTSSLSTSSVVDVNSVDGRLLQTTTTTNFDTQTTTVTDQLARVGVEISTGAVQTVTRDMGSKIVDTSIIPFIRPRLLSFYAKALKPETQLYATFDGVDVTDYCYPAIEIILNDGYEVNQNASGIILSVDNTVTADILLKRKDRMFVKVTNGVFSNTNTINWIVDGISTGSAIISSVEYRTILETNIYGDIAGYFWLPNNDIIKFRTGERVFRLTDVISGVAETAAAVKYVAQGLSQSTERTLISTKVATSVISPRLDMSSSLTTSTTTVITGVNTNTIDITPPPPPSLPPPVRVACGHNEQKGEVGRFEYEIEFGSNTGNCGITYDTYQSIPDRFTLIWNGNEYTTGFVGGTGYNAKLRQLGFSDVVGGRLGNLIFNKTSTTPTKARLIVDAPLQGTDWKFKVICPNAAETAPIANTTPRFSINLRTPSGVNVQSRTGTARFNINLSASVRGTTAKYVRITNLVATANSVNGTPIPGITLGSTSVDFTYIDDRTIGAVIPVTVPLPGSSARNFTVNLSGNGELFSDAGYTSSTGKTDTDSSVTNISRMSDMLNQPDPVAQTFFVNATNYPNGLFLDSIDLYFRAKSDIYPVTLQLRPTVNGYPSSKDIIPYSIVNLLPSQISVSNTAATATNFKFESPIYLPTGEYSFVVICNTNEYEIYTARIGDLLLTDPDIRITEQPAIGSMFKSQNSSTWTPIQEEDIMFKINKCVFTANTADINLICNYTENGNTVYDMLFADGEVLDFSATNIDYSYKTRNLSGTLDSTFTNYQLGFNEPMPERKMIRADNNSDLQMNLQFSTTDTNVSPVVDLSRFSTVLVQNIINNAGLSNTDFLITDYGEGYSSNATVTLTSDTGTGATAFAEYIGNNKLRIVVTNEGSGYTGNVTATVTGGGATANAVVQVKNEVDIYGGNAVARYITRKVTLASGFESSDLKIYFLANIPGTTSVKVYCKVAPIASLNFEKEPWREMILESSGTASDSKFVEYKYKSNGITALPNGDLFKTFAIKLVLLSTDTTKVPLIRDLRVIALDE